MCTYIYRLYGLIFNRLSTKPDEKCHIHTEKQFCVYTCFSFGNNMTGKFVSLLFVYLIHDTFDELVIQANLFVALNGKHIHVQQKKHNIEKLMTKKKCFAKYTQMVCIDSFE